MRSVGKALIGEDRLISLDVVNKIYVSPRLRAQQTLKLLLESQDKSLVDNIEIETVGISFQQQEK